VSPESERTTKGRARHRPTRRDQRRLTLGQNFIADTKVAQAFVEAAGPKPGELVVEVGAGAGAITGLLAARRVSLIALELDPDWAKKLEHRFRDRSSVEIVRADALRFQWPGDAFRVVGNVPFYISTSLLHRLLDDPRSALSRADLIMQLQVARKRAAALPSNALNLSWQPWFSFEVATCIPATKFRPVPAVDAAHLVIRRRSEPLLDPRARASYTKFVRAGFSHGGLLRRGLRTRLTKNEVSKLRRRFGFDDQTKASALSADDWVALFEAVRELQT
jgi:23S rRNA (adenine-N6)-dimethyltransferase